MHFQVPLTVPLERERLRNGDAVKYPAVYAYLRKRTHTAREVVYLDKARPEKKETFHGNYGVEARLPVHFVKCTFVK